GDTFDEKLSALRECLESLPDPYKKTIRLRFEDGFMPAKISEVLTVDLEAVKKRLYRAKSMLSRCLHGKLDAHSAATEGGATA
ncbi:MAG: sigma-70 family RNA polymerase sigma factor, partial [Planctomycetota bacterium]